MSVKITVDSTGFDDFYGFFNTERTLSKDDVDKLFDKPSYQSSRAIRSRCQFYRKGRIWKRDWFLPKRTMGRVSRRVLPPPRFKGDCFVGLRPTRNDGQRRMRLLRLQLAMMNIREIMTTLFCH